MADFQEYPEWERMNQDSGSPAAGLFLSKGIFSHIIKQSIARKQQPPDDRGFVCSADCLWVVERGEGQYSIKGIMGGWEKLGT